jgi:BioD-like phosphotransacetylase family protein
MKPIFVASTKEQSGKSFMILGLGTIAKDFGKKVSFFKPFSSISSNKLEKDLIDNDINMMKHFFQLNEDIKIISPFNINKQDILNISGKNSEITKKICESYKKVANDNDILFIESSFSLSTGSFINCSVPELAAKFNSKVLLVERFRDDLIIDRIFQAKEYCMKLGISLLGVILNRVPKNKLERAKRVIKPFLEKKGIKILGVVDEDSKIGLLTVNSVHSIIGGTVLAGKKGMNNEIKTYLVGAMTPESAIEYFRKAKNELIITGGDRTEIILSALEAGTSALVLTGNLYPNVKIFPRADELNVPLILVPYDTYTTLQLINNIVRRVNPIDKEGIKKIEKKVREKVDWKQIITSKFS